MWHVGCDRMVFAINSNLCSIKFNSTFDKWSLDQGQKTKNPLIPLLVPLRDALGGSPSGMRMLDLLRATP